MPPPASAERTALIAAVADRDRYHVAEAIYLAEVRPRAKADVIVDNTDFARPAIVGPSAGR